MTRFWKIVCGAICGISLAVGAWAAEMPTLPPNAQLLDPLGFSCASGETTRWWVSIDERSVGGLLKRGDTVIALWKFDTREHLQEIWIRRSPTDVRHFLRDEFSFPDICDLTDAIPVGV